MGIIRSLEPEEIEIESLTLDAQEIETLEAEDAQEIANKQKEREAINELLQPFDMLQEEDYQEAMAIINELNK